jgi:hypothetical protein
MPTRPANNLTVVRDVRAVPVLSLLPGEDRSRHCWQSLVCPRSA